MALYVVGYWVGIHFYGMVPQFNCIFCIQSNLELTFLHVAAFVKIPFQHINYPNMLRMCRPNFMKVQGPVTYFSNLMKTHDLNSSKCKKYNNYVSVLNILEYLLSLNHHASLMVEVDMFSVFSLLRIGKRKKKSLILSATILI